MEHGLQVSRTFVEKSYILIVKSLNKSVCPNLLWCQSVIESDADERHLPSYLVAPEECVSKEIKERR